MDREYSVYMHRFPNGKVYIGITKYPVKHRWARGEGYSHQPVYKAIKKYGWENIEHIILFSGLTKEEAEEKEIELIEKYHATDRGHGYNIEEGGYTSKLSEATKEKIRMARLGTKASEETKKKMSKARKGRPGKKMFGADNPNYGNHKIKGENNPFYGKKHSPEVIQLLREKATGVIVSPATRKKLSEAHKGLMTGEKNPMYGKTGAKNVNSKKIGQFTKEGEFVREWDCAADVEREMGIAHNSIGRCCNGNLRSAGGYVWRHL